MTASLHNRRFIAALVTFGAPIVLAVACGSNNQPPAGTGTSDSGPPPPQKDATPPPPQADAGEDSGGDSSSPPADSGSDTGSVTDSGTDAFMADANEAGPVCNPDASLGSPTLVVGTSDAVILGGVTPDECVLVWTDPSGAEDGGPAVEWVERATSADPFGAVQSLDPTLGPFPSDKVAVSGDGLRLVLPSADHTQIVEISRAARGTAFGSITTGQDFVGVNPTSGPEGTPGIGPFGSPALSPSFGIWAFDQGTNGLVVTTAAGGGEWSTPPVFPAGLVPPASSAKKIVPTGWSSDGMTLFFWDETAQEETMAWRDPWTGSFVQSELLGSTENGATPSGDCSHIYFAGATIDIFMVTRQ